MMQTDGNDGQVLQPTATSAAAYLLYLIVLSVPVIGLVLSVVWGLSPVRSDRKNVSLAMIVINIVWTAVIAVAVYQFYFILSNFADISFNFGW